MPLDRPRILAILNVTPDSFYDGGRLPDAEAAADAGQRAVEAGADAVDIGGESTRPGAAPVSVDEQIARVVPAIRALRSRSATRDVPICVDTTRAPVAEAALDAGADAINDVSAGRDDPGMLRLAARRGAGLILMHRRTEPGRDRYSDEYERPPAYEDVVVEVREFLAERTRGAREAGVEPEAIVIDPGLGFGKTVEQNLLLLARTPELIGLGYPMLSGLSRKSFTGRVGLERNSSPEERLPATLAMSLAHVERGALLLRVHDVPEHAQALRVWRGALERR